MAALIEPQVQYVKKFHQKCLNRSVSLQFANLHSSFYCCVYHVALSIHSTHLHDPLLLHYDHQYQHPAYYCYQLLFLPPCRVSILSIYEVEHHNQTTTAKCFLL